MREAAGIYLYANMNVGMCERVACKTMKIKLK